MSLLVGLPVLGYHQNRFSSTYFDLRLAWLPWGCVLCLSTRRMMWYVFWLLKFRVHVGLLFFLLLLSSSLLLLIILRNDGLIQSSAKPFTWDLRQKKGGMLHYLGEKILASYYISKDSMCLLALRAFFVIYEQHLWVIFLALPVVMIYQRSYQ